MWRTKFYYKVILEKYDSGGDFIGNYKCALGRKKNKKKKHTHERSNRLACFQNNNLKRATVYECW